MSLIFLVDKEYCEKCSSYMRNSGVKTFEFKTSEESETFINFLHGLDTKSEAFKAQIELKTDLPAIEVGTVAILHSLSICPKCLKQNIAETVSVFNGKNWKAQASLKYNYSLPEQTDVSATFKGNTTEKKAA